MGNPSGGKLGFGPALFREHQRCVMLGDNRPENRGADHQDKNRVEHAGVNQGNSRRIECLVAHQSSSQRGGHLRSVIDHTVMRVAQEYLNTRPAISAAMALPVNSASTSDTAKPKWSIRLRTNTARSIGKPVTRKKNGTNIEFARNPSFSVGGRFGVASLIASPARKAAHDTGKMYQSGKSGGYR